MVSCAVFAVLLATSLAVPSSPASAACPAASTGSVSRAPMPDDDKRFVFLGAGNGHGLGMSQYGAYGAARLGCSATQILTSYYRGARPERRTMPDAVGVWMLKQGTSSKLRLEPDANRDVNLRWYWNGRVVGTQREQWTWTVRVSSGRLKLVNHRGRTVWSRANPGRPLFAKHSGKLTRLQTYSGSSLRLARYNKWDLTRFAVAGGRLDVQQRFADNRRGRAMDKYLSGLGEILSYWPAAAHEAQAIAARTYVVRVDRVLNAGTSDQYYQGHNPAYGDPGAPWREGVDATTGRIMVDSAGRPIQALYSASMAGWTEDNRYVWGGTAVPYLQPVDDSAWANASDDPYRAWARSFTRGRIAAEFGFDAVRSMSVAKRGSADRADGVIITGTVGGRRVTRTYRGWDVKSRLGLRSPGFVIVTR